MPLSPRLSALADMVSPSYTDIWDCCCDHGYLGETLLMRHHQARLNFIDQVPELIERLRLRLGALAEIQGRWSAHCLDLKLLSLPSENPRPLMIIAGVGGDLVVELVEALLQQNPEHSIDLLLCPVRQNYWVRQEMSRLGFGLLAERIVQDKERFYEVIHLSACSNKPISTTGNEMWNFDQPDHRRYLEITLAHYERQGRGGTRLAQRALKDYQNLR